MRISWHTLKDLAEIEDAAALKALKEYQSLIEYTNVDIHLSIWYNKEIDDYTVVLTRYYE